MDASRPFEQCAQENQEYETDDDPVGRDVFLWIAMLHGETDRRAGRRENTMQKKGDTHQGINPELHQRIMRTLRKNPSKGLLRSLAVRLSKGGCGAETVLRGTNTWRRSTRSMRIGVRQVGEPFGGSAMAGWMAISQGVVLFTTGNDVANADSTAQTIINGVKACVARRKRTARSTYSAGANP